LSFLFRRVSGLATVLSDVSCQRSGAVAFVIDGGKVRSGENHGVDFWQALLKVKEDSAAVGLPLQELNERCLASVIAGIYKCARGDQGVSDFDVLVESIIRDGMQRSIAVLVPRIWIGAPTGEELDYSGVALSMARRSKLLAVTSAPCSTRS
jgi:hypothetical protein